MHIVRLHPATCEKVALSRCACANKQNLQKYLKTVKANTNIVAHKQIILIPQMVFQCVRTLFTKRTSMKKFRRFSKSTVAKSTVCLASTFRQKKSRIDR